MYHRTEEEAYSDYNVAIEEIINKDVITLDEYNTYVTLYKYKSNVNPLVNLDLKLRMSTRTIFQVVTDDLPF